MRRITLTFDNGPDTAVTPQVLAVLERAGIRATFFVVGRQLERPGARSLSQAAHAAGHWIGNHTWSHDVPLGLRPDRDGATAEIARTQDLIGNLAHARRFFRPFGGGGAIGPHLLNRACLGYLVEQRHTCVLWNAIPGDWRDPEGWVDTALAQCAALEHALVVLHDLPTGAMARLAEFIERARDAGGVVVQDFPADCVVLERGRPTQSLAPFLADPTPHRPAPDASAPAAG